MILKKRCQGIKAQFASIKTLYILFSNVSLPSDTAWNHSLKVSLIINLVKKNPSPLDFLSKTVKIMVNGPPESPGYHLTQLDRILRNVIICIYTFCWVFFPHILPLRDAPFWSMLLNNIKIINCFLFESPTSTPPSLSHVNKEPRKERLREKLLFKDIKNCKRTYR